MNTITTNTTKTITSPNTINSYYIATPYTTTTYNFDWDKNYFPFYTTSSMTLTSDSLLIKDGNSFKDII